MPQARLSMRKLKEVLRLHSLGLKQQQIARSCLIAQSTVHQYLKAAAAAGVSWPLPPDWDERRLEEVVSGAPQPTVAWHKTAIPDFGAPPAAVAGPPQSDAATGMGGISREPPGGLQLQPFLPAIPELGSQAGRGSAAGIPRRREAVRRLRRRQDSDL